MAIYCKKNLTQLIITYDLISCYCNDNFLTELLLPDNLKRIYCHRNKITELYLNNNLIDLACDTFVELKNINNKNLTIMFF